MTPRCGSRCEWRPGDKHAAPILAGKCTASHVRLVALYGGLICQKDPIKPFLSSRHAQQDKVDESAFATHPVTTLHVDSFFCGICDRKIPQQSFLANRHRQARDRMQFCLTWVSDRVAVLSAKPAPLTVVASLGMFTPCDRILTQKIPCII